MVGQMDYYESKKSDFFTQFNEFCNIVGILIEEEYGAEFKNIVMGEIKGEYESIFEELPYIGGEGNSLTSDLVSAAQSLALYKVLKRHHRSLEEIGRLAYQAEEEYLTNNRDLIPPMTNPKCIFYVKRAAEESLKKRYPEDWVYEFIEGNEEFDFGTYFTECGIQKFFHEHDADEFTPYLCAMDMIMSECGNLGLERTQTLAEGGEMCDFQYKGGRKTKVASTVIKKD